MKMHMFSIYDSIAEVFNKPFTEVNAASATRLFKNSLSDNVNKRDFFLYHVGEYDDNKGTLIPYNVPKRIADMLTSSEEAIEMQNQEKPSIKVGEK
jgi:hypothetical protein